MRGLRDWPKIMERVGGREGTGGGAILGPACCIEVSRVEPVREW